MGFLTLEEIETHFIDDRNRELWETLNSRYQIGVFDQYDWYELKFMDGNNHVVMFVAEEYNKGLFTHELLHLRLRSFSLNSITQYVEFKDFGNTYIIQSLVNLLNNIEHIFFFDDYIELGFEKEDFVMDFATSTFNDAHFKSLDLARNLADQTLYSVYFLSMQITMYAEDYYGLKRNKDLNDLNKYDPKLFLKGNHFFNEIIDFEIKESQINNNQERFNALINKFLPSDEKIKMNCLKNPFNK